MTTTNRRSRGSRALARLPLPVSFSAGTSRGPNAEQVRAPHSRHPGTVLAQAVVDCALYRDGGRLPGEVPLAVARKQAAAEGGFVWVGLHEPDADSLQEVAEEFGLHPLAVEDAYNAHQRPKLDSYGDTLFLVLKTVRYVDHDELIDVGELMVFVGSDFVVTVRHGQAGELGTVRKDLEDRPQMLAIGPAAVLYAVVDRVVDGYGPAVYAMEEDIDEIGDHVFSVDRNQPTERIYRLKREALAFRRAVEPLSAATARLAEGSTPCVDTRTQAYFRDVHDHVLRASEAVASMDELLDSALSSNVAQVTLRQNEDTRKISAWVAIAAVCTLVAGIYGMNFTHMPELEWRYGYLYALALMAVLSLLLYRGFKRNDWL